MKNMIFAALGFFSTLAIACPNLEEIDLSKVKKEKVSLNSGKPMEVALPNMHCGGCAAKVKTIVSKYPELGSLKIDLKNRKASISCADGKTTCDAGAALYDLKMAGYMLEDTK